MNKRLAKFFEKMRDKEKRSCRLRVLRDETGEKKVVIGAERVLKELKAKRVQKVYLASNCPAKLHEDVKYYASVAEIPVVDMAYSNEELGVFCKKNFFVSVLAIAE